MRPLLLLLVLGTFCFVSRATPALITVDQNSTVGVLLDEFSPAARTIVEEDWTNAAEDHWIGLAKLQVLMTWYPNTWRMYAYDFQKLQLPPPMPDQIQITITSDPYTFNVDVHEYIGIDYNYYFVMITNAESINASEPALVPVNGTWTETFIVPVDPMYIHQRTGYDCADEAEFPIGSVDTENIWGFFDPSCVTETQDPNEITSYSYHRTPYKGGYPTSDCVTSLDLKVGSLTIDQVFTHIEWDDALADEWRTGPANYSDTPDLLPIKGDIAIQRIKYSYGDLDPCAAVEGCVLPGWRRILAFDASTTNIGKTPMHVGYVGDLSGNPPPGVYVNASEVDAQQMVANNVYEYSSCHGHYHFQFYSRYSLDALPDVSDNPLDGHKLAWCLESLNRVHNNEYTDMNTPYWLCAYQGISTGWADQYVAGIPCQWIDITKANETNDGLLMFEMNPAGFLCEGELARFPNGSIMFEPTDYTTDEKDLPVNKPLCNYTPNYSQNNNQSVSTSFPQHGSFIRKPCPWPQHSSVRDCGWSEITWNQECSVAGGRATFQIRGDADVFVWRVCESSRVLGTGVWCSHMDALAYGEGSRNWSTEVEIECPKFRDMEEYGRLFSLYVAPLSSASNETVTTVQLLVNGREITVGIPRCTRLCGSQTAAGCLQWPSSRACWAFS